MRRINTKILISTVLFVLLSSGTAWACSTDSFPRLEFDPQEYVFFGTVTGYTEQVVAAIPKGPNVKNGKFTGYGLKIKIDNIVNMPVSSDTVEVFPVYAGDTMCTPAGAFLDDLKKNFPVGSNIRAVGGSEVALLGTDSNANPRVAIRMQYNGGQMFVNTNASGKMLTTPDSEFDYRESLTTFGSGHSFAESFVWMFEVKKDLKRLATAKTENDRYVILLMLAYAFDKYNLYPALVKKYLNDDAKIRQCSMNKKLWGNKAP